MRGDCLYLFYCIFVIGFFPPLKSCFFDGVFISLLFFYSKIKHSENQRYKYFFLLPTLFLFFLCQFPKDKINTFI